MAATLASLREQARQRADMVNSEFVSDDELTGYINKSLAELYDLLIAANEDHYVQDPPQSISITANTDAYALAADFYKLLGVDAYLNGQWRSLKPYMFAERNSYQNVLGPMPFRYRLRGSKLAFVPIPDGSYSVRVWYAPRFTPLAVDGDSFDAVNGWEEYVIVDAAIKMLQKEESDVQVLLVQKADLRSRIQAMASNRDSGEPQRIVDVTETEADPFFRRFP